ncbi:MAG: hypothetical protein JEZ08_06590 [Clostridiales bacterium]|nr:hypothetical protein [Clostridiales bacterium]
MKIDTFSTYQIGIPNTEAVGNVRPVKHGEISPLEKTELDPNANMENLKSIYSDKQLKRLGIIECETCANRTYVDGSDDPGVSFKSPGKIDPKVSASVVMSHELEHVSNEQASANAENREIVSQSVSLHASICPECGVSYIAGGETRTVTKGKSEYSGPDELFKGVKIDKRL